MKTIGKAVCTVLILLGHLLLLVTIVPFGSDGGVPIFDFTLAVGLITAGMWWRSLIDSDYKGGIPSAIGTLMTLVGATATAGELDRVLLTDATVTPARMGLSLFILALGLILLWSGHRNHRLLQRLEDQSAPQVG